MACFILRALCSVKTLNSTRHVRALHSGRILLALNPLLKPDASDFQFPEDATSGDPIFKYSSLHSTALPDKYARLHNSSISIYPGTAAKTISPLQGQLLQLLMRMTRPRHVLELGCFMGYSAMAMADGMPEGASLYTCEKDPRAAEYARELFIQGGYSSAEQTVQKTVKIELLEGDAMSSLELLAKRKLQFDAIFLDADKGNYINYFNFVLDNDLLSQDGYILADNVLFRGMVLQSKQITSVPPSPPPSPQLQPKANNSKSELKHQRKNSLQKTARHMDKFNRHVKKDPRVTVVILPVFDGLSIIMKNRPC
ncbi:hypothetical protein BGX27_002098 [Mortierella sp. AM989]|nr:hypothetical protein BGX27_002098 [Mortierella sp. AM989]